MIVIYIHYATTICRIFSFADPHYTGYMQLCGIHLVAHIVDIFLCGYTAIHNKIITPDSEWVRKAYLKHCILFYKQKPANQDDNA